MSRPNEDDEQLNLTERTVRINRILKTENIVSSHNALSVVKDNNDQSTTSNNKLAYMYMYTWTIIALSSFDIFSRSCLSICCPSTSCSNQQKLSAEKEWPHADRSGRGNYPWQRYHFELVLVFEQLNQISVFSLCVYICIALTSFCHTALGRSTKLCFSPLYYSPSSRLCVCVIVFGCLS